MSHSFLSALYDKLREALLARLIGPRLVEKLPVLYENRGFVAVFSIAPHEFSHQPRSESFFPYCLQSPKDCIFRHQLCPKWKRHTLTSKPGHTLVTVFNPSSYGRLPR